MKKPKKIKESKALQLDRVSVVLESLTGFTLEDVIKQACACSEKDAAQYEIENILKMDAYLKSNKKEIH